MRLEFESNSASMPLVENHDLNAVVSDNNSPEVMQMLRDGIKAAQEGNRAEARQLLLRVTEADSNNENAWLWLASISEYPEELLVFLNNVLSINPDNERAIEWAKATKTLLAKTFVQRGINAAKDEQKDFAKQCFLQAIVHDAESELAWLWLASVSDSLEEKVSHLQKVLKINPDNENALSSMASVKTQMAQALMPEAKQAAVEGRHDDAQKVLEKVLSEAPNLEDAWLLKSHLTDSLSEKMIYFEKVLDINPDNEPAKSGLASLKSLIGDVSQPVKEENAEKELAVESVQVEEQAHQAEEEKQDVVEEQVFEHREDEDEEVDFSAEDVAEELHEEDSFEVEMSEDEVEMSEEESLDDEPQMEMQDSEEPEAFDEEVVEYVEENLQPEEEIEAVEYSEESEQAEELQASDEAEVEQDLQNEAEKEAMEMEEEESVAEFSDAEEPNEPQAEFDEESKEEFVEEAQEPEIEHSSEPEMEMNADSEEETVFEQAEGESQENQEEYVYEHSAVAETQEYSMDDFNISPADIKVSEEVEEDFMDEPAMPSFDEVEQAEVSAPNEVEEQSAKLMSCPFCNEANEPQSFACKACRAILTLSDIEMILGHEKANKEIIKQAVEMMEEEKKVRSFDSEELKQLGIGYINIKDMRKGFEYLQEAAQANPEDVVLVSHIDSLAIRLAEIEQQEKQNESKAKSAHILVVDDSPTVRKLISGKLEKSGHEVVCAVDGMDALAKINEVIPDLILLDITMPRMDGYQVCKLIRSNEATQDVPVVMISGKDGFFDKVRGKMAGTTNYITKPFGPETLMKAVNEYIN